MSTLSLAKPEDPREAAIYKAVSIGVSEAISRMTDEQVLSLLQEPLLEIREQMSQPLAA